MPTQGRQEMTMKQSQSRLEKMASYVSVGMQTCGVVATDVIDNEKDEIGKEKLAEVEDTMLEFCKMHQEVLDFTSALKKVEEEARTLDENDPVDLEDLLDKRLREVRGKSKKKPITEHEEYVQFKESLQEQMNSADGETPPANTAASVETPSGDDEVEISQADIVTKCPITGKDMVNPVRNIHCGHKYDKDGILSHIQQRKGKARCPIGGCPNQHPIVEEHLEPDAELKKTIQKKAKGAKRTK